MEIQISKKDSNEKVSQVQEFFGNTSLHGVRYFNERSLFRRLVWFLALGAAMGVCGKQIYDTFKAFYRRPFSTSLTRHKASVMDFPAVTLCNMNMISKKQYAKTVREWGLPGAHNISDKELGEEIQVFLSLFSDRELENKNLAEKIGRKIYSLPGFYERGKFLEEIIASFSHSIKDTLSLEWLIPCTWRTKTCTALNFTAFVNLKMGQCFTFNSGRQGHPKLRSIVPGHSNGLRLKLNLQENYHVSNDYSLESGFKVLIHDQNEYPLIEEAGFAIQPGTHTFAAIREQRYRNLPTPFKTKCASPDKPFNKHLNYSYSINACVRQCMHEYIIKTCHCQALHNITRGEELCSLNDAVQCVFPIIFGDHADKLAKCINECPEPCRYKKYQTKLSYASAVSNSFSRAISSRAIAEQSSGSFRDFLDKTEEERQEFIRNNVVSLDVFFEELGYDVIEQKPTFDDWALLGAVGGTLGLFLGTSVLTVLEFLDFFVMCLIRLSRRNKSAPKEEELGEINHSVSLNLENRPSF